MRALRVLFALVITASLAVSLRVPAEADVVAPTPSWLSCPDAATLSAARGVVLLVPGTGSRPAESFGWGYQRALTADGFATCTVALPQDGLGSFTDAAVRVRSAIEMTAVLAGRSISVVGHSQGGALPVWDVKFWPQIAPLVDDIVSLSGPFGGTRLGNELCLLRRCSGLAWQLRVGSRTVKALRTAPLPTGDDAPAITSLAAPYDEIVRPQPAASQLDGATNIVLTKVCPLDPSEHGLILGDPVGYALTLDALTHDGPADPTRLPAGTCQQAFIPHGDPLGTLAFVRSIARFATGLANPLRWVSREPALPAYAEPYAG
ncbi:alpha/beta fold hydrolase [Nocardioides fonticola]|uniref:Alpha/beta fold hydrolase n=1 Tax=Nocardioides fonticola TaxID=450363 RepID=A0ABP7XG21_9ACTN